MIKRTGAERTARWLTVAVMLMFVLSAGATLTRGQTRAKPGFNLFSAQQDIQVGQEAAAQVDKEMPLVNDAQTVRYLNNLGRRLASYAPYDNKYPWTFKMVNSQEINAFALPGGYIYVNRGVIEAAETEAQLAGVMAHEISHVSLRHGTNQASKMTMAQMPLSILGGMLGQSSSVTAQLAQLGIGFGVNSVLLKYSRTAETQADEVGTYILHRADYDPRAMMQFFQILGQKYPQRTVQFFSSHPNPENRVKDVDRYIATLGTSRSPVTSTPEFNAIKKRLLAMPAPPKTVAEAQAATSATGTPSATTSAGPPPAPSTRLVRFQGPAFSINYPDNWQVYGSESDVKLAPAGGLVSGAQGETAQVYGASISLYQPPSQAGQDWKLADVTKQLVEYIKKSNPNLSVTKQKNTKLRDRQAVSTTFTNDSPVAGQKEQGLLVTVRSQDQLLALVFVAPTSAYGSYQSSFNAMLKSLVLQ